MEPFVEGLRAEFAERLKIRKVIAPENRRLCIKLKVMTLPTILAFAGGEEVGRLAGENEVTRRGSGRWWRSSRANGVVRGRE